MGPRKAWRSVGEVRPGLLNNYCGSLVPFWSGRPTNDDSDRGDQTVNESLRPHPYHKKPLSRRQSAMADYYPLLSRAVSRLAVNNAQTRQKLYEHARTILVAELERNSAERSPQASLRERIEFETTVLRVEAKSQFGHERSPETLLHRLHALRKHGTKEPTPDFASLLRAPAGVWPAPVCLRC
jgi:hypothetical protein